MTRRNERLAFTAAYRRLRRAEGWAAAGGRELPDPASPLWRARLRTAAAIAELLRRRLAPGSLVADVGAGGDWLRGTVPADWRVVGLDLAPAGAAGGWTVAADMRALPLRSGVADGAVYLAALHYVEPDAALAEAARILNPGAPLVVADSPVYRGEREAEEAGRRSAEYFAARGEPGLAAHYRPLVAGELRASLARYGFAVERFDRVPRSYAGWRRRLLRARFPMIVARRVG